MDQRFIEHDLPLAEISEESAREKYLGSGNPATLHIWWARRPLAASRATTLATLIRDPGPHNPEKRREIRQLIKKIAPLEAVKDGDIPAINKARELVREHYEGPPTVLDSFAGGGAIPLESLRLGAETYAGDYNPVAVFIQKATFEWPNKFSIKTVLFDSEKKGQLGLSEEKVNLLNYLVEKWGSIVQKEAEKEIGDFYPKRSGSGLVGKREVDSDQKGWNPVGYIWARTIPCQNPTCGATIPLVKQFWLCNKEDKKVAYRPVVDHHDETVDFELLHGNALSKAIDDGFDPKAGTVSRANASCPVCGQVTEAKRVRELARDGFMDDRHVVTVFHHPEETGKKYRLADESDHQVFEKAQSELQKKLSDWPYLEEPLPSESLPPVGTLGFRVNRYGITEWKDLFNDRQRLALITLLHKIKSVYDRVLEDAKRFDEQVGSVDIDPDSLAKAVVGYLALSLDREVENSTTTCRWNPRGEKMQGTFGRQALPMGWDYCECNPFGGSVGDWGSLIDLQLKGMQHGLPGPNSDVKVTSERLDAADLPFDDNSLDTVITDPPYYDNVPYSDLSDFFYVWLKRSVGDLFPELFSTPTVPKSDEAIMEPERHEDSDEAKVFFEERLGESFQEMHRVLKPNGVAVVVYAHKTTEGWETMLSGLIDAGFIVTGSWPIHTESKTRLRAAQSAALASSIYMVCRKSEREELGFWNDIQPQIKDRVEEKLQQFWDADVIRGGDFFISAIGPGMEAYSRYARVETYDGEEVTVRDLLQYIRGVATDFLVRRLLRHVSSGSVDKEGQFYLTYRWTFRDTRVEYDDALRIAKAEGVNIDRIAKRDSFIKKTRKYIYVHGPQDRDDVEEVQDMVDAMHLACQMWEEGRGKNQIGKMLAKHGYSQSPSFWQFCQAISECLPDGNKEKQWLEGMLMSKNQYQQVEAAGEGSDAEGQITIDFDEEGAA
jgi:adenine-specific DNA methylase